MIRSHTAPAPPRDDSLSLPAAYRFIDRNSRGALALEPPHVIFIEVTNHCNLLCETCPRTFVSYESPQTLSWENFIRIVEQFPDMQRAILHGIGEPLINQDLPKMIEYLKAGGVTVLFNTNGTLLTESKAYKLIESGLDEMRCSLDAADPRTYVRIRGAPLLPRIVENLKRFVRLQTAMRADKPRVSIWMTGMRENIGELPDLVRLASELGIRDVYVQRMVYYLDTIQPPGMLGKGHALFDNFVAYADECIAEAETTAREFGVALAASGATDPRSSLQRSTNRAPRPWEGCLRPWTTSYVTANGNCLPCCIGPFATTDYESLQMGNLFEREFEEIWNGDRYKSWRTRLLSEEPPEPCRGCGVHWSL